MAISTPIAARTRESFVDHINREELSPPGQGPDPRICYKGPHPPRPDHGIIAQLVGLRTRLSDELVVLRNIRGALFLEGKTAIEGSNLIKTGPPESLTQVVEHCEKLVGEIGEVNGEIFARL